MSNTHKNARHDRNAESRNWRECKWDKVIIWFSFSSQPFSFLFSSSFFFYCNFIQFKRYYMRYYYYELNWTVILTCSVPLHSLSFRRTNFAPFARTTKCFLSFLRLKTNSHDEFRCIFSCANSDCNIKWQSKSNKRKAQNYIIKRWKIDNHEKDGETRCICLCREKNDFIFRKFVTVEDRQQLFESHFFWFDSFLELLPLFWPSLAISNAFDMRFFFHSNSYLISATNLLLIVSFVLSICFLRLNCSFS